MSKGAKKITLASDNSHTGKPFQAIWTLCLYFDMMCYALRISTQGGTVNV